MNELTLVISLILGIMIVITVGVVTSVAKGDQATCTTTKLGSTSLIVCTYKDQVLFNKEVKDE